LRLDGQLSRSVFKPLVKTPGVVVTPEDERVVVEELNRSFPGSSRELTRLPSAGSRDTASGLSMSSINASMSIVEGLVVSIDLNPAQSHDDSFLSANSAFQAHTHGAEESGRNTAIHVTVEEQGAARPMRATQISPERPKKASERK